MVTLILLNGLLSAGMFVLDVMQWDQVELGEVVLGLPGAWDGPRLSTATNIRTSLVSCLKSIEAV